MPGAADDRVSGSLFPETVASADETVRAAVQDAALHERARRLPDTLRLGTSSWNFPGWRGLVWDDDYPEKRLSRDGITAYAAHPLLRTVSLDRAFYRPLSTEQYRAYAQAVPEDFRFVVKAPARVTDSLIRGPKGRARTLNPDFLDPDSACSLFAEPAVAGLGARLGALVFQFSPLVGPARQAIEDTIARLHAVLQAVSALNRPDRHFVVAVEVRDTEWLCPAFVDALSDVSATYCLGLHPRLPPITDQLPVLRRLWPGPFVCRWNLNLKHGAHGYENARRDYAPFDRLVDPDPDTRVQLARVAAGTARAGQPVFVTINNKAEGSAPCSVAALAEEIEALDRSD